ncbi:MAG: hypothetical protein E7220_05205 [Clostridiales bacterium]|nr:hypothetical protein [Clostridiales bacterium]
MTGLQSNPVTAHEINNSYLKSDSWGNKYHYKYRKNGKLKKMTEIYGSYPNEPHTFDKKGRITGLGNIDLGTFKHYYNKKGYLQRVREHDPECDVTYEYTFDSKKRIRGIKEKTLIVDAKDGFDCYYTLDKKGFVTKVACQRVNDNGKEYPVTYNISYKKDSKKRIKSIIIKRVENGKKIKIVFKYKKAKTKNFKYYRAIINRCAPQYAYDGVYFPRNIEAFP